jgi:hypothetical protein
MVVSCGKFTPSCPSYDSSMQIAVILREKNGIESLQWSRPIVTLYYIMVRLFSSVAKIQCIASCVIIAMLISTTDFLSFQLRTWTTNLQLRKALYCMLYSAFVLCHR